jgi:hypothetical protein
MRFAETAREVVTIDVVLNPQRVALNESAAQSVRAARFAAEVANRYRPSRAMRLIIDLADFALGTSPSVDLTNLNPLNPVDSAVMGSILDNNVPPEGAVREAMSALLELRNPNEVAKQWLNDALCSSVTAKSERSNPRRPSKRCRTRWASVRIIGLDTNTGRLPALPPPRQNGLGGGRPSC